MTYNSHDPLCFILCLADTIEPIKKGISPNQLKLSYKREQQDLSIIIKIDDNSKCEQFFKSIAEIELWMAVKIKRHGEQIVELLVKNAFSYRTDRNLANSLNLIYHTD